VAEYVDDRGRIEELTEIGRGGGTAAIMIGDVDISKDEVVE
jgi:hypothetical protein